MQPVLTLSEPRGRSSALGHVWSKHSQSISIIALILLGVVLMAGRLTGPVDWGPDALFYQAQVYEIQGESQNAALQRAFSSPAAHQVAKDPTETLVAKPAWVKYSAQFYRRRWVMPLIAAAISPVVGGDRALQDASILGYLAIGLLLFALLRCRFTAGISLLVSALALLIVPLHRYSGQPLADSWGLATEIAALLAACKALERGGRWMLIWPAAMLLATFAKDSSPVLLIALAGATLVLRTRRSLIALGLGIMAAIPAPAIFGASIRTQLAYAIANYQRPPSGSWSYVIDHFPHSAWTVIRKDLEWPALQHFAPVYVIGALCILAAVIYMCWRAPTRDPFFLLQRFALVGCVVTVGIALNYTGLRLELMFVPCVAAGLAFGFEGLHSRWLARPSLIPLPDTSTG
ncbi:MAG TPA: hypothetical protein VHV75_14780 [Solirubrobacteraceae bacterium]|nr:hypothetical protein [Solirubrobacteraceae bacterium]